MEFRKADNRKRSIYDRAAHDGAWLGVYFAVLFLASVGSMYVGILNILVLTMILLVPFITYHCLRRTHIDAHGMETFGGLWMQGILMFGCASLIFSLVCYLFMRVVYPGFIPDTMKAALELYKAQPGELAAQMTVELQAAIDRHVYPAPATVAIMGLWLGTFTGSVLSMFEAAVVRFTKIPPPRNP